jgi:RNA polymerase sigma-70 factor, ECF subfamily
VDVLVRREFAGVVRCQGIAVTSGEPRPDTPSDGPRALAALADAELMARVAQGDSAAIEVLYDRYNRVVYSFALRIIGDRQGAEELLQEVFFRVWRQADAYSDRRGSFVTWLLSITHNMGIDELRRRRRRPQRADQEDPLEFLATMADRGRSVEQDVLLNTLRDQVNAAMNDLPDAQREALELAYFRGLTQREIAEELGEPLGTIKTRMRLGLRKLRTHLEQQEVEPA